MKTPPLGQLSCSILPTVLRAAAEPGKLGHLPSFFWGGFLPVGLGSIVDIVRPITTMYLAAEI
jgi:hypothetical protein